MSSFIRKITFRKANNNDFNFVVNCIQEFVKIDGSKNRKINLSRIKETFNNCLNNPNRHPLFIAENNGENIGMCLCNYLMTPEMGSLTLHVAQLFLKENYRNKGYGTKFINYLKDYCKENDIHQIEVLSPPDSSDKYQERIKFFNRHEFDTIGPGFVCSLDENERNSILSE